jgi:GntR family transcriptional regulator, transcriptional repressor for pyruvate dehydrogenase complex
MTEKPSTAAVLRELIVGGRLRPGDRLSAERELATALGVSRSATREALCELAAEGLVESRHGSGNYVAEVDAVELAEVRLVLEPLAAQLAAERHTAADAERFTRLRAELRRSVADPVAFASADLELHRMVVSASGNSVLDRVQGQLSALLALSRGVTVVDEDRLRRSLAELEPLVAAILARDGRAASTAMRRHLRSVARSAQARASHHEITHSEEP